MISLEIALFGRGLILQLDFHVWAEYYRNVWLDGTGFDFHFGPVAVVYTRIG